MKSCGAASGKGSGPGAGGSCPSAVHCGLKATDGGRLGALAITFCDLAPVPSTVAWSFSNGGAKLSAAGDGRVEMTSLFQRLDEEEAIVRGELTALREKIAVTEERLARLTITRETAASLLGNHGSAEASGEGPVGPDQAAASDNSARESPTSFTSTGATSSDAPVPPPSPLSWEVARRRCWFCWREPGGR